MTNIYSEIISLEATDTDCFNRWKISSVVSHMLAAAGVHSDIMGWGWNHLKEDFDVCLVLVHTHLHMDSYPSCYQKVKITTWPESKLSSIITRYFTFEDPETGERYGYAAIQCVFMDMVKRLLVRNVGQFGLALPESITMEPPIGRIPKLVLPKELLENENNTVHIHKVNYTDLDYNGHANNSKYVEWVCNLFSPEHFENRTVREFAIKYQKEAKYGNKVAIKLIPYEDSESPESDMFFIRGNLEDDTCSFEAKIIFK